MTKKSKSKKRKLRLLYEASKPKVAFRLVALSHDTPRLVRILRQAVQDGFEPWNVIYSIGENMNPQIQMKKETKTTIREIIKDVLAAKEADNQNEDKKEILPTTAPLSLPAPSPEVG